MAKQEEFKRAKGWGGKRKGAGRPNLSKNLNHLKRPLVDFKKPLHITQRLNPGYPTLRRREYLRLFQRCAKRVQEFGLHVIHFSILSNHIHLCVEAKDNMALASGMKSILGTFALALKRKVKQKGPVFRDRYHLKIIKTAIYMRNCLRYILMNYAKHSNAEWHLDEFSSAWYFDDWPLLVKDLSRRMILELDSPRHGLEENVGLMKPRSWLASQGWKRVA